MVIELEGTIVPRHGCKYVLDAIGRVELAKQKGGLPTNRVFPIQERRSNSRDSRFVLEHAQGAQSGPPGEKVGIFNQGNNLCRREGLLSFFDCAKNAAPIIDIGALEGLFRLWRDPLSIEVLPMIQPALDIKVKREQLIRAGRQMTTAPGRQLSRGAFADLVAVLDRRIGNRMK